MSDREFEKKVQHHLEGLQFEPSDAVWTGLEARMGRRRRRRAVVFWLLAGLLFLSAGGYFLFSGTRHSSTDSISTATKGNTGNEQPGLTAASGAHDDSEPVDPTAGRPQEALVPDSRKSAEGGRTPAHGPLAVPSGGHSPALQHGGQRVKPNQREKDGNTYTTETAERLPQGQSSAIAGQQPAISASTGNTETGIALRSSLVALPGKNAEWFSVKVPPHAIPPDSASHISRNNQSQPSKWSWGITAGSGISNPSADGLFGIGEKSLYDNRYSSNVNYSPGSAAFVPPASELEKGSAFFAGAFAERRLSQRISVSAGLQYQMLSSRRYTGARVDSSRTISNSLQSTVVANYYQNSKNNTYTNRYHFISVPLEIKWDINRGTPSLRLSAGVNYRYLLASNHLRYDQFSGIYYRDNSQLNKQQLGIAAGLSVRLFGRTPHPLDLGPSIDYSLTPVAGSGTENQHHFFSTSIRLNWYLHK